MNLNNNFIPQFKEEWVGGEASKSFGITTTEDHLDIPCTCHNHIMRLWRDEGNLSVAFYVYAPNSFTARLKKAWKLLFKEERVLLDDVVIDQNGIEKLKRFLK